jgi:hypothetical protein
MASNAFGDSFLANSSPGASVGFTFDVNSQDAVDFAQYTYARLLLGYTLAKATYGAFTTYISLGSMCGPSLVNLTEEQK